MSNQVDWPREGRAFVPGCGRVRFVRLALQILVLTTLQGYDPIFIATVLGLDTIAIDISPTALQNARV